jgi:DNA-binding CsgD family transcriptional regulator
MQQTNLDDFVGLHTDAGPRHFFAMGLNRPQGDRPFGPRQRRLLHRCAVEFVPLLGTRLAPGTAPSVSRLAPRQRQVLLCFFEGDSEKQAAARLGIARDTVHEYVRRLHRAFGVSSRGELLARCAPLLPVLRAEQAAVPGDGDGDDGRGTAPPNYPPAR